MDAARPQMLRRQDWDFSGRTKVMVEVMLENLAKEKSASERQGIVDRLTTYVRSFSEEFVDFERLNRGLRKNGFEPLSYQPTGPKRPLSEMSPEDRAALDRSARFHGQIGSAARWASTETKGRLGELSRVVHATCGDGLSAEELQTALSMLATATR